MEDFKIDYTKYLDVKEIAEYYKPYGYNKIVLITDNGTGKTYTATNWVMEHLIAGKNCCWIRNTDIEALKCVNGLNAGITRFGVNDKFVCKTDGIYEVTGLSSTGKPKTFVLRCPIVYLSSLSRSVPQEIHAQLIVLDEFIDGSNDRKFILKDYASDLKKAISRLIRPISAGDSVTTIALSNPHTPTSDLLYSLGIDFDWDLLASGQVSYSYNDKTHTVGICIPKQFDIKEMGTTYTYWNGETGVKENYQFVSNEFKRVVVIPDECVEWLGRISYHGCFFAYGWWKDKHDKKKSHHMYVRKCSPMEFKEFTCYACTPVDAKNGAIYINESKDRILHIYRLVNASMEFNCYCDTHFTFETIIMLHNVSLSIYNAGYSVR